MSELNKCPFCGGKAEFVKMGIAKDIPLGFVRCAECGIRLRQENCTEDFARDEWNRRKPMDNIVEKLQEEKSDCGERTGYFKGIEKAINIIKQEINKGSE